MDPVEAGTFATNPFRGAIKNAVSTVCGVILSNILDPQSMILTWIWFRHLLIASGTMLVFNEARYWKTWADRPDDNRPIVLSFFFAFFIGTAFQLLFRWTRFF